MYLLRGCNHPVCQIHSLCHFVKKSAKHVLNFVLGVISAVKNLSTCMCCFQGLHPAFSIINPVDLCIKFLQSHCGYLIMVISLVGKIEGNVLGFCACMVSLYI